MSNEHGDYGGKPIRNKLLDRVKQTGGMKTSEMPEDVLLQTKILKYERQTLIREWFRDNPKAEMTDDVKEDISAKVELKKESIKGMNVKELEAVYYKLDNQQQGLDNPQRFKSEVELAKDTGVEIGSSFSERFKKSETLDKFVDKEEKKAGSSFLEKEIEKASTPKDGRDQSPSRK